MKKVGSLLLALLTLGGCSDVGFYTQGLVGQCQLLLGRRDIARVLEDGLVAPELKQKLEMVQLLRRFAIDELHLPDDGCYTSYVELERPYVVWNVVAAPAFSLAPKTWCYPLVGCVPYRGWFSETRAAAQAETLKQQGFDTLVYGVDAYSSIGWFKDPVLSTFLRRSETGLAALLFHEWAHRVVYVADDAAFSESFARSVEIAGVARWLKRHGDAKTRDAWRRQETFRRELQRLAGAARKDLEQLYTGPFSAAVMKKKKHSFLNRFSEQASALARELNLRPPEWLSPDRINNAALALFATYQDHVPAFLALLRSLNGDFAAFYREVRAIADKPVHQRREIMAFWHDVARRGGQVADIESAMDNPY